MKHNTPFDFQDYWKELSGGKPYPPKKLCRHVLIEAEVYRKKYLYELFRIKNHLLSIDENQIEALNQVELKSSWLLRALNKMWDIYKVAPYPMRHRRQLEIRIGEVEQELYEIGNTIDMVDDDTESFCAIVIGDEYVPDIDLEKNPQTFSPYYVGQPN
ncbi:MAG: hypothetical protein KBB91_01260 [Candidatus Pacebacteria bacterium]|nr:hypothetical protein [Candidatus Paceibacterota bacterium]MBP9701004.1 hypothetical protein [Candidatus Paceibacterota bacterium]